VGKHGRQSSNGKLIASLLLHLEMASILIHRMPPLSLLCDEVMSTTSDMLSQCTLYLWHRRITIEFLGKRLAIRQNICYHTRMKSEGESGVSRHSPDPATSVERIQQL
jgi:hypothetical protein